MATMRNDWAKIGFSTEPLKALMVPLLDLKALAEAHGLLALEDVIPLIDHPVFRTLLSSVANGDSPVELIVSSLHSGTTAYSVAEKDRIAFFTFFCLLLQRASKNSDVLLHRCLEGKTPLRSIVMMIIEIYMPFRHKKLNNIDFSLQEVVDDGCSFDARTLYVSAVVALTISEIGNAVETLNWFRSGFRQLHPFLWAFQDYLESTEVERAGEEGLLGALKFGFLSSADMPGAYTALSALYASGRSGPFTNTLLGMLYLYNEESVPYDLGKAFALFSESAAQGSALGAEWRARFLESREPPAFPGDAVPRSVRGTEVFSAGEISNLLLAFSSPEDRTSSEPPLYYDPGKVSATLLRQAPGWSAYGLWAHAARAASANDAEKSWDFIKRGAVLKENWAVATVVGAWTGLPVGLFEVREDDSIPRDQGLSGTSAEALRACIRADRRSHPVVVLAAQPHAYREDLATLAERLTVGKGVPRNQELASRLKAELDAANRKDQSGDAILTQEDIFKLLGQNSETES